MRFLPSTKATAATSAGSPLPRHRLRRVHRLASDPGARARADARSSASTPSPTTTPRAIKERNLEQCRGQGDVRFAELDLAEAPLEPLRRGRRRRLPPGRAAGREDELGPDLRRLPARQPAAPRSGSSRRPSSRASGSFTLPPRPSTATPRPIRCERTPSPCPCRPTACPSWPARRWRAPTSASRRPGRGGHALLLGVRAQAAARHGVRAPSSTAWRSNARSACSATAARRRDFTYVGDVVEATLAAMQRAPAGRVYNIGGGSEISLLDALTLCERIVGRRLDVHHVAAATGDARRTIADFGLAAAELGWTPSHVAGGRPARPGRERRGDGGRPRSSRSSRSGRRPPDGDHATRRSSSSRFARTWAAPSCSSSGSLPRLRDRGVRTEILTRAVRGWPRTEPIAGSVVRRTPRRRRVAARLARLRRPPRSATSLRRRSRIDLVHAHGALSPATIALGGRLLGLPCLVTVLGTGEHGDLARLARKPLGRTAVAAAVPVGVVRGAEHRRRAGAAGARRARRAHPRAPQRRRPGRLPARDARRSAGGSGSGSGCRRTGSSGRSSGASIRSRTSTRCSGPPRACPS